MQAGIEQKRKGKINYAAVENNFFFPLGGHR